MKKYKCGEVGPDGRIFRRYVTYKRGGLNSQPVEEWFPTVEDYERYRLKTRLQTRNYAKNNPDKVKETNRKWKEKQDKETLIKKRVDYYQKVGKPRQEAKYKEDPLWRKKDWDLKNKDIPKIFLKEEDITFFIYRMLKNAEIRAYKKGIEFDLKIEDITVPEFCPILNTPLLFNIVKEACENDRRSKAWMENSASLDRIDNNKGYIRGNVCVISHRANTIKSDASIEEVERVLNYMKLHGL